jgi:glucan 1,3-beta-glucosidase
VDGAKPKNGTDACCRGFLFESQNGPIWLYGTAAEHSVLYDYQFSHASNIFMGAIQHETAYFQANPNALTPFTPNTAYTDPTFAACVNNNCPKTWGLRIINCTNIFQYGAGLYSFFENWSTTNCLAAENCQQHMVDIQNSSDVYLWALGTVGTSYLISYQGTDLVPYSVNKANFADTIVLFEIASSGP